MQNQPLFVYTKRGYINLSQVLCIKPPERGLVRFVFSDHEYMDLPAEEAQRVESVMVGELSEKRPRPMKARPLVLMTTKDDDNNQRSLCKEPATPDDNVVRRYS
jgi:hypothetical protein